MGMICTHWRMTHADIINCWPKLADFASDIGVSYGTAKAMRRRSSIPDGYWLSVIRAAKTRGIGSVDLEALAAAVAIEPAEASP